MKTGDKKSGERTRGERGRGKHELRLFFSTAPLRVKR